MLNNTNQAPIDTVDATNLGVYGSNDSLIAPEIENFDNAELEADSEGSKVATAAHDAIFASGDFTSLFSSEASTFKTKRHSRVRQRI